MGRRDNDILASEEAIGYGLRSLIHQQALRSEEQRPKSKVQDDLSGAPSPIVQPFARAGRTRRVVPIGGSRASGTDSPPSREAVFAVGGVDESQQLCAGSANRLLQRRLTLILPRNLMFDGIDAAMSLAGQLDGVSNEMVPGEGCKQTNVCYPMEAPAEHSTCASSRLGPSDILCWRREPAETVCCSRHCWRRSNEELGRAGCNERTNLRFQGWRP